MGPVLTYAVAVAERKHRSGMRFLYFSPYPCTVWAPPPTHTHTMHNRCTHDAQNVMLHRAVVHRVFVGGGDLF